MDNPKIPKGTPKQSGTEKAVKQTQKSGAKKAPAPAQPQPQPQKTSKR